MGGSKNSWWDGYYSGKRTYDGSPSDWGAIKRQEEEEERIRRQEEEWRKRSQDEFKKLFEPENNGNIYANTDSSSGTQEYEGCLIFTFLFIIVLFLIFGLTYR